MSGCVDHSCNCDAELPTITVLSVGDYDSNTPSEYALDCDGERFLFHGIPPREWHPDRSWVEFSNGPSSQDPNVIKRKAGA